MTDTARLTSLADVLTATAIADIDELVAHLGARGDVLSGEDAERIAAYRTEWSA